ncbi:MAG: TrkH family potassium uptake protein, partial [Candidatus Rokuibacteriota bacterium]
PRPDRARGVGWGQRLRRHFGPGMLLALIAAAEYGSPWRTGGRVATFALAAILTAGFIRQSLRHFRLAVKISAVVKSRTFELALSAAAIALLASKAVVWARELADPALSGALDAAYRQYAAAFLVVAALRVVAGDFSVRRLFYRLDLQPAQTVALGFGGAIVAGAILLSLPVSVSRIEDLSLLDALFTATSAVTVTGLAVYDPATALTATGQVILLVLIQLGGLGTMVVSASLVVLAGRRLRLHRATALREAMDVETVGQVRTQVKGILALTAACEAGGALLLFLLWRNRPEVEAPLSAALFHSVSAFCNAGFSVFSSNLAAFRDDAATCAVIAALIVVGGLGFPVLRGGLPRIAAIALRRRAPRLSLHARLALLTTVLLLAAGTLGMLLLEWGGALAPLTWPARLSVASFLSVTARTAGFNTVPIADLTPAALWLLMLLMFIGGSPGSTAGGVKTTTAATMVASLRATLGGRPRVEALRRTIPDEQVAKALALVGVSAALVAGGGLALLATQAADASALAFEAVSAFGTVGLSLGVTPLLDNVGKAVLMVLMFAGRTGPLTLGFALAARRSDSGITYPNEKIMLG